MKLTVLSSTLISDVLLAGRSSLKDNLAGFQRLPLLIFFRKASCGPLQQIQEETHAFEYHKLPGSERPSLASFEVGEMKLARKLPGLFPKVWYVDKVLPSWWESIVIPPFQKGPTK